MEPFPAADLVLLCSFGPNLDLEPTRQELCRALHLAGYGGPLGRHLVATSPLLQRGPGKRYVLHQFAPPPERVQEDHRNGSPRTDP